MQRLPTPTLRNQTYAESQLEDASQSVATGEYHSGPDLINPADFAWTLSEVSGKPVKVFALLDAEYSDELETFAVPQDVAQFLTSFGRAVREDRMNIRNNAVQELTGCKPKSLREVFVENRAKLLASPAQ